MRRPAEFAQENVFFQGFLIQKPVIRIALGVNLEDVEIHASSGMKVYQVAGNYKLISEDIPEVRIKGQKEKLTEKFIVQAAQSRQRKDAEDAAKTLKGQARQAGLCVRGRQNESGRVSSRSGRAIS